MKTKFAFLSIALFIAFFQLQSQWNYPATKQVDSFDTYWGKKFPDPFRWIENLKDEEVFSWYKKQASFTDSLLNKIPERDSLIQRFAALEKDFGEIIRFYEISKKKNRFFYKKQAQAKTKPNYI